MKHPEDQLADAPPPHRTRRQPRPNMALNVTAMIDVVFLLLIYFLAATNFKLGEEVYRLDLPERGQAAEADPFQLDEEPLRIRISSLGAADDEYDIWIDGPYDQPRSFAALHDFLQQRQIGSAERGGLFAADHPIIIQPRATARWEHVIGAFNAAARAGYSNITFGEPAE